MPPAGASTGDLKVTVTVNNAAPNASLTWDLRFRRVQRQDRRIAYRRWRLRLDQGRCPGDRHSLDAGQGEPAAGSDFHVAVNDGGKVAACGDLEAAKTSTEN
jgi:hypothetical protein